MTQNNLYGKICMVTGATSGIGEVTATALAKQGAATILVGRSADKGAATVRRIQEQTGNLNVSFLKADLSSQTDIRQVAEQFQAQYSRLDVLVNNVGGVFLQRKLSVDGIEMTFALNHLSGFMLTNLLLNPLKTSSSSRIVNVSSKQHIYAHLDESDWQMEKKYSGIEAYHRSKLTNLLFTYELARRLEDTGVTVNAVKPGFTKTSLGRNNGWSPLLMVLRLVTAIAAQSVDKGAETSIYLATSPDVETVSGKYFDKQTAIESSKVSYDVGVARRLWQLSEQLTGITK